MTDLHLSSPALPPVPHLRALLLDLDGTLVDSNGAHTDAWVQTLADQGFTRTADEVRPLIGMGGDQLVPKLTGLEDDSETGEALVEGWQNHFKPLMPGIRTFPGARELLEWAREMELPVVLASSGEDEIVEGLLKQAGLLELVTERVRSDDVNQTKPRPDVVQVALKKAGVAPEEALFIGDTLHDARAARAAGVPCVLLREGGSPGLSAEPHVLGDLTELLTALKAGTAH